MIHEIIAYVLFILILVELILFNNSLTELVKHKKWNEENIVLLIVLFSEILLLFCLFIENKIYSEIPHMIYGVFIVYGGLFAKSKLVIFLNIILITITILLRHYNGGCPLHEFEQQKKSFIPDILHKNIDFKYIFPFLLITSVIKFIS